LLVLAGADSSDRSVKIFDYRPLQILWLKSFADPSAGSGAVIAKRAADSIIVADACKQRVDLFYRGLRTVEAKFERAAPLLGAVPLA
jgi:hypothetical protein